MLADAALAQQAPVRVRGEIEKVDGNTLTVKARDGNVLTIAVPDNCLMAIVKASLADIKPNCYIGVTADPQADGTQKAIAIHIFLEAMRGTGEGHRPWDLRPGTTHDQCGGRDHGRARAAAEHGGEIQDGRAQRRAEGAGPAGRRSSPTRRASAAN